MTAPRLQPPDFSAHVDAAREALLTQPTQREAKAQYRQWAYDHSQSSPEKIRGAWTHALELVTEEYQHILASHEPESDDPQDTRWRDDPNADRDYDDLMDYRQRSL